METTRSLPPKVLLSRARGAILGAAIGDALALPNQHYSRTFLRSFASALSIDYAAPVSGFHPRGQYGAATQVMQAVAASVVESRSVSWDSMVSHLIPLWRDNLLVEREPSTTEAMELVLRGAVERATAGLPPGRAEAAPMSRVPAIALHDLFEPERLPGDVETAIRITHRDPRPIACAAAAAAAIAANAQTREFLLGPFLDSMAQAARIYDPAVEQAILDFPRVLSQTEPRALRQLYALCPDSLYPPSDDALGEYCVPSFLTAVYYFLRFPYSYEQAVDGCLRLGGHIDMAAFTAGAISGALVGDVGIPSKLVAGLLNASEIASYANRIIENLGDP